MPGGTYQVRITLAGDPASVVFDTGEEVPLPADADLLIAAVENTGPGASPVSLVVLDGTASSEILDGVTPATVYAVHASPDAPNVDLLADGIATATGGPIRIAADVPFTAACEVAAVPAPETFDIVVTAAGDPDTVALTVPFETTVATESTVIVSGFFLSTPEIQAIPLTSDTRGIATETKVRITHGSPSTADVDIYVVADGTVFTDDTVTPDFGAVPFTADTGILSLAPGLYDVYVTPAGTKDTIAIEVQDLPLTGGQVLDIIARDPLTDGSEGPLPQLIVIDYATIAACTP